MKTFLANLPSRIKSVNATINLSSLLKSRPWILNNEEHKEVIYFQEGSKLTYSIDGVVTDGSWELMPDCRVRIRLADTDLLYNLYHDDKIIILRVDGREDFLMLADEDWLKMLSKKMSQLLERLEADAQKEIKQKAEEERREIIRMEEERRKKAENEAVEKIELKYKSEIEEEFQKGYQSYKRNYPIIHYRDKILAVSFILIVLSLVIFGCEMIEIASWVRILALFSTLFFIFVVVFVESTTSDKKLIIRTDARKIVFDRHKDEREEIIKRKMSDAS